MVFAFYNLASLHEITFILLFAQAMQVQKLISKNRTHLLQDLNKTNTIISKSLRKLNRESKYNLYRNLSNTNSYFLFQNIL